MKKHILGFLQRGVVTCGFGPLVLAIVYLILQHNAVIETLPVREVCIGIFSLFALAFIAGGMNFVYQVERLSLMGAILIHGCVLYVAYLVTYIVNGWLERGGIPIVVFTGIFVVGYLVIWAIIYIIVKKKTEKINAILKQKQQTEE